MNELLVDDLRAEDTLDSSELVGDREVSDLDGPIAVRLHDIFIADNQKLFGTANIRVDVLAVQGNLLDGDPTSFYTPTTIRFSGVSNDAMLLSDDKGLLAYYGWPQHFLTLSVLVSRDTKDSDDLAALLQAEASSPDFRSVAEAIGNLALSGGALIAKQAISMATTLGSVAYKVLRQVTGNTVGVYRGDRLAYPDRFGLGRNPATGVYKSQDLSLWYEVINAAEGARPPS
jgi:hypothetical protein